MKNLLYPLPDLSKCGPLLLLLVAALPLYGQQAQPVESLGEDLSAGVSWLKPAGIPRVVHYTRNDFSSHPQFWVMCQADDGIFYFGNKEGAHAFDAEQWHKVHLPNHSAVLSLLHASDGKVYAGGFNEFGVIEKDELGKYSFSSMLDLLSPEERNMGNISFIHEVQGHVVFLSYNKLIAVSRNKAAIIPAINGNFTFSAAINDKLFLRDEEGVKSVDLESLAIKPAFSASDLNHEDLVAMLPGSLPHQILLVTSQGSLFTFDPDTGSVVFVRHITAGTSRPVVTSAVRSSSGIYYFGTLGAQIIALDGNGQILANDGKYGELQDNTVLHLFESREGGLWALLNNGIDCIDVSSPVSTLLENASVLDAVVSEGRLYVATHQGVFAAEAAASPLRFRKIAGLDGLAYSLGIFDGQLLCSHERGLFAISDSGVKPIGDVRGVWKVIPVKGKPGYYLACTYSGLFLLQSDRTRGLLLRHKIQGFYESSREILQSDEPGVFWVCHGYKGVYRVKIDEGFQRVITVEHFKDENGLPSPFNINVVRWKGDIVFTTNHGVFSYNKRTGFFEPHGFLNDLFGTSVNVHKLLTAGNRTWFVHGDEAGWFDMDGADPLLEKGLFRELKGTFNTGMACIVPLGENGVLMGTTTGLYAFDLNRAPRTGSAATLISLVSYVSDAKTYSAPLQAGGQLQSGDGGLLRLPDNATSIRFGFTAPALINGAGIQYSYLMENLDERWSDWQPTPFKEYTHLKPGAYVFRVKARSVLGAEAVEARYSLRVPVQWYQTRWATAFYILLFTALMYAARKMVRRKIRLEKQKTRHEEIKKQKVLELELEQIKLAREKELIEKDKEQLEEDVIYKSKELANYTMLLVRKRELLTEIKDELGTIKNMTTNEMLRGHLKDLNRKIGAHLQDEEHILVFESNFERVHHEFFTELKTHFPDLTAKELRLCALVRMNLTNKEIAPILNISIRGVETARYRLRKRLSIGQEENMVEFLEKLSSLTKGELVEEVVGEPVVSNR